MTCAVLRAIFLSGTVGVATIQVPSESAPLPPLGSPSPGALARETEAWRQVKLATDGEHSVDQSLALLDRYQAIAGETSVQIEHWRFFFLAMAKRWDDAFRQSARMRRMGLISGAWLFDPQYAEIQKDPRWAKEVAAFDRLQAARVEDYDLASTGLWTARPSVELRPSTYRLDGDALYRRLHGFAGYAVPKRTGRWYIDTLPFAASPSEDVAHQVEFCVYIPKGYRPQKPTPAVMWVHGAWFRNLAPRSSLPGLINIDPFDNPLYAEAAKRGYIEILPLGYSTVASTTKGNARLFADVLARVKRTLNVDDDRVFMAGHSNGGSSCFATAAEDPTPFACFYPVNGWPLPDSHYVNLRNRRIESLTGEEDDLFPPAGVKELHAIAAEAGADWNLHLVPGGSHPASEFIRPYAVSIFDHMDRVRRAALSPSKVWEADRGGPKRVDWLEILQVDASRERAPWHGLVVARDSKRTDAGETLTGPLVQNGASGCVRATYRDNVFELQTSRVGRVRLWIHPDMVRMDRPVRVVANGKEAFNARVAIDPALMMNGFLDAFDRSLVWANAIDVEIPATP